MFTFFHHLLPLLGLLAGAAVGWMTGWGRGGVGGGILGIVLGAILGGHAARLPGLCILWTISRQLRAQSTASLLEDLYGPASAPVNLILLELDRRGEQIHCFLPRVGLGRDALRVFGSRGTGFQLQPRVSRRGAPCRAGADCRAIVSARRPGRSGCEMDLHRTSARAQRATERCRLAMIRPPAAPRSQRRSPTRSRR